LRDREFAPGDGVVLELHAEEVRPGKRDTLTRYCRECDVRFACNGGCPKDRFATSPYGEPGQHHLCPGYQDFFHHVREPMEAMMLRLRLRQGCAPSELMSSHALDDSARGGCSRL
jgi:uncharacterized protein